MQSGYPTVVSDPPVPDRVYAHSSGATLILGLIEVISGVLLLIFMIAGVAVAVRDADDDDDTIASAAIGLAIAGLICFVAPAIMTGGFSIASARTKSTCLILTTMVFAILNALLVAPYLVGVGIVMISAGEGEEELADEEDDAYRSAVSDALRRESSAMKGLGAMILIIGLTQLVVTIVMAAFSCRGTCCCKPYPGQVNNQPVNMTNVATGVTINTAAPPQNIQYGYDQPKV